MLQRLQQFMGTVLTFSLEDLRREDGQTTLEYTVVAVLVVVMAGVAFLAFQTAVTNAIGTIAQHIADAVAKV
jgi:hypothetical protein